MNFIHSRLLSAAALLGASLFGAGASAQTPCELHYKFDTDFKFKPSVHALLRGEDYRKIIGKVSASVSIDFHTPVLEQKYLSTELETTIHTNGDVALFFNLVIYAR